MENTEYELVFAGAATAEYFPRYKRMHASIESAQIEARKIYGKLDTITHPQGGTVTACHNAIIYGPGCDKSGMPVALGGREAGQ